MSSSIEKIQNYHPETEITQTEITRRQFLQMSCEGGLAIFFGVPFLAAPKERTKTPVETSEIPVYSSEPKEVFPGQESDQFYGSLIALGGLLLATAQAYHLEDEVNYRDVVVAIGDPEDSFSISDRLTAETADYRYPSTAINDANDLASTLVVAPQGLEWRKLSPEGQYIETANIPTVIEGAQVVKAAHAIDEAGRSVVAAEEYYYRIENGQVIIERILTAQMIDSHGQVISQDSEPSSALENLPEESDHSRQDPPIVRFSQTKRDLEQLLSEKLGKNNPKIEHILKNSSHIKIKYLQSLKDLPVSKDATEATTNPEGYYLLVEDGDDSTIAIKIAEGYHPQVVWSPKSRKSDFFIFAATAQDNIFVFRFAENYDQGKPIANYKDMFPFQVIRLDNGNMVAVWRTQRRFRRQKIEIQLLSPECEPIGERIDIAKASYSSYSLTVPHAAPVGNGLVISYNQGSSYPNMNLYMTYAEFSPDGNLQANRPIYLMEGQRRILMPEDDSRIIELPADFGQISGDGKQSLQKGESYIKPWLVLITRNMRRKSSEPRQYRFRILSKPRQSPPPVL